VDDFAAFARLIEAVRTWLGQLVVIGGWAHRLHRFDPRANPPAYSPLRTLDIDLALSDHASLNGDMRAALAAAGFKEEFSGERKPPITQYRLGDEGGGFYAEFLAPLRGGEFKRNGEPDVTLSKAGITAQKLRHIDVLLIAPWTVRVGLEAGVPVAGAVDLLVPNAVSFIVQKLLIHKYRNNDKKAQDVLYIHDTLELFGASLDELRGVWVNDLRPRMPARTAKTATAAVAALFGEVTDTIRDAARIPRDRQLMPDRLRAVCEYGLSELLQVVT
jgi:hypothetical protein